MKESDLAEEGKIPVYGASGVSGFTENTLSDGDSILITKDGSGVGFLRYVHGAHSFVGTINSLAPKENVYLPYVFYAMQNIGFEGYRTGQAIPHIYFKDYRKEPIFLPPYTIQKKLAGGLEHISNVAEEEKCSLKCLQTVKKYLLASLFT